MERHHNFLSLVCQISNTFHSTLLLWENSKIKICTNYQKNDKALHQRILVHRVLLATFAFTGLFSCSQKETHVTCKVLFAFALLTNTMFNFFVTTLKSNGFDLCVYVNNLAQLRYKVYPSLKYCQTERTIGQKLLEILLYICCITTTVVSAIFVFLFHGIYPCQPSLAGYQLLCSCTDNGMLVFKLSIRDHLIHVLLLLINYWLWSFGWHVAALAGAGILLLCTLNFNECIRRYIQQRQAILRHFCIIQFVLYYAGTCLEVTTIRKLEHCIAPFRYWKFT